MSSDAATSIALGIVQGLTEFLPVSSSAHLIIVSEFLDGKPLPLALNVGFHVGTLVAVLLYFYRDWLALARSTIQRITQGRTSFESSVLLPGLIVGTLPAAVIGLTCSDLIESIFHSSIMTAVPLAVVGLLLWVGDRRFPSERELSSLSIRDAAWIGVAQALALIPGVSRSGITILAGRTLSLHRADAARFSFLLGTPAMLGAVVLKREELMTALGQGEFFLGVVVAAVTGCLAIAILLRYLQRFGLAAFAVYRMVLAAVLVYQSM